MQYVLHVFLLRRALEAAKFSCDLKAVYGRESARAFMARRPCVGATAESNLAKAPPLGIALRSPSHIGRVAALLQTFACPPVPVCRQVESTRPGRGCARQRMWTARSKQPVVKYGRGRVRSRKLQGQRANRGRWARAVSRAWRGCSFPRRKGAGEFYLIHRH